jgi:RNA recognition motif-containing protein
MQSIKDSSQQDRRVYVGNLSYDVKWHHLKDFMRQGTSSSTRQEQARLTSS